MKIRLLIILLLSSLLFSSCSEYNRLLKSDDVELKFTRAKAYYEKGRYLQAANLLQTVVVALRGTAKGEEALYLIATCYYNNKDYITACSYYSGYARSYPRGNWAEDCAYHKGMCFYQDSPEAKLDQVSTQKAINEFTSFQQSYPKSIYVADCQAKVQELRNKLAYKAFLNARLYFRLGNYQGNNYKSCVIAATQAIQDYPESVHREELAFLILKAKYSEANESVARKQEDRYRDTVEEYSNFSQEYPDSEFKHEADKIHTKSQAFLDKLNSKD